jgi:hypothetical protein
VQDGIDVAGGAGRGGEATGRGEDTRVARRTALWTVLGGAAVSSWSPAWAAETETLSTAALLEQLQVTAIQAYRAKDLSTALRQLTEIIALDAENPVWYERRGQVRQPRH